MLDCFAKQHSELVMTAQSVCLSEGAYLHTYSLEGLWAIVHPFVEFSHGKLQEDFRFFCQLYALLSSLKKEGKKTADGKRRACVFLHWNTTATHNDYDPVVAVMCLQYVPLSQFI